MMGALKKRFFGWPLAPNLKTRSMHALVWARDVVVCLTPRESERLARIGQTQGRAKIRAGRNRTVVGEERGHGGLPTTLPAFSRFVRFHTRHMQCVTRRCPQNALSSQNVEYLSVCRKFVVHVVHYFEHPPAND